MFFEGEGVGFRGHVFRETKKDYHVLDKQFQLVPQNNLKNGDKVLLGTKLYQVRRDKEYDIIVTQDRADKMWHINLNPSTLTPLTKIWVYPRAPKCPYP